MQDNAPHQSAVQEDLNYLYRRECPRDFTTRWADFIWEESNLHFSFVDFSEKQIWNSKLNVFGRNFIAAIKRHFVGKSQSHVQTYTRLSSTFQWYEHIANNCMHAHTHIHALMITYECIDTDTDTDTDTGTDTDCTHTKMNPPPLPLSPFTPPPPTYTHIPRNLCCTPRSLKAWNRIVIH